MTSGCSRTSAGGPVAMTRPCSSARSRSDDLGHERNVVFDDDQARAHLVTQPPNDRRQRLHFPLRDPRGGFVQQDHRRPVRHEARQIDDTTGAGGQLPHELVAVVAEAHQLDQLVGPQRHLLLGVDGHRQVECSHEKAAAADEPLLGDRQCLLDGEFREQTGVLERTPEAEFRTTGCTHRGDVASVQRDRSGVAGREAGDEVEHGGLAGTVRPDHPDDLVRPDVEGGLVDGADPAEAHRELADRQDRLCGAIRRLAYGFVDDVCRRRRSGEEDRAQQVGTFEQFLRRAVEHDRAALHEVRTLGNGECDVDALFDEHDGHTVVGHPPHDREQLADDHRCQTQRQLVDQQHLGAHHEAHRRARASAADRPTCSRRASRVEWRAPGTSPAPRPWPPRPRRGRVGWSIRRVRRFSRTLNDPNTP